MEAMKVAMQKYEPGTKIVHKKTGKVLNIDEFIKMVICLSFFSMLEYLPERRDNSA